MLQLRGGTSRVETKGHVFQFTLDASSSLVILRSVYVLSCGNLLNAALWWVLV